MVYHASTENDRTRTGAYYDHFILPQKDVEDTLSQFPPSREP